jgi:microcystin-dependent protein
MKTLLILFLFLSIAPVLASGPREQQLGDLLMQQITTPSNPPASHDRVYVKSDHQLYVLTPAGSETVVGGGGSTPVGGVLAFAGSSAPTGYLLCDGSAVSRTTYSALFAVIGITHGQGNGTTTFNLPDYRGRFLRGVDGGAARDPDRASRTAMATGGNTGDNVGSVQLDDYKSHTHNMPSNASFSTRYAGGAIESALWPAGGPTASAASGGNETRPTNANVTYIVKF